MNIKLFFFFRGWKEWLARRVTLEQLDKTYWSLINCARIELNPRVTECKLTLQIPFQGDTGFMGITGMPGETGEDVRKWISEIINHHGIFFNSNWFKLITWRQGVHPGRVTIWIRLWDIYEVMLEKAEGRINYHLIESRANNLIVLVEF